MLTEICPSSLKAVPWSLGNAWPPSLFPVGQLRIQRSELSLVRQPAAGNLRARIPQQRPIRPPSSLRKRQTCC